MKKRKLFLTEGQVFNNLMFIEETPKEGNIIKGRFKCICGNEIQASIYNNNNEYKNNK